MDGGDVEARGAVSGVEFLPRPGDVPAAIVSHAGCPELRTAQISSRTNSCHPPRPRGAGAPAPGVQSNLSGPRMRLSLPNMRVN